MESVDWKETEFQELLVDRSISYGVVQPGSHTEQNCVPIIRVNNIRNGVIETNDVLKISAEIESKYRRTRLEGGELLITVVGSVGECAIVPDSLKGWNVARAVSVARISKSADVRFVRYSFKSEDIIFQMYGGTNDTVQPTLNLSSLKTLKLKMPSLPEQRAIAGVLSSLDDKIDLLHRQNKTLEAMAETLFRQWFVEDASDDWSLVRDFATFQNGYAFRGSDFSEIGSWRVLKIKNISGGVIDVLNTDFLQNEIGEATNSRFRINAGEVLIGMTGAEIGKLGIVPPSKMPLLLNQRVGALRDRFDGSRYIAYLHLKSEYGQDFIWNTATGSAQPNISSTGIESCPIPRPRDSKVIEQIALILKEYFERIVFNLGQVATLEKLRDTLLPKLMSGDVRVQYE